MNYEDLTDGEEYINPPGIAEDNYYDEEVIDKVVDCAGYEIFVGSRVNFIVRTEEDVEELWSGEVVEISDLEIDYDEETSRHFGTNPIVYVDYYFVGVVEREGFETIVKSGGDSYTATVYECSELNVI
jgi:hypothetical protein